MGEQRAASVAAGVVAHTTAELADTDENGDGCECKEPVGETERSSAEIGTERRIDERNDREQ